MGGSRALAQGWPLIAGAPPIGPGALGPLTISVAANATAGSLLANVTGLASDETLVPMTTNDGRFSASGKSLVLASAPNPGGTFTYQFTTNKGRSFSTDVYTGPKLGTYAYNAAGSVSQFYSWLGRTPDGAYGEAHGGRGADKTTLADARADWTGSVGYVLDASGWVGAGRTVGLTVPMLCKFATFTDAIAGAYDADYRKIFSDAKGRLKATQKKLYARVGWEFNSPVGGFQYWGTGNDPTVQAQYVQLFQRIWGIAQEFKDQDFEILLDWVMNPGSFPFIPCYPGDQYVARIGMDCYPGLDYKNVYRAPQVIGPEAQVAIWDFMRTRQYGMDDAVAFAKARGKPFIIPEFAVEWDNGQAVMDVVYAWMIANKVEAFGWWNDSDTLNVVSGISGILTTNAQGVVNGQKSPDIVNTGASIRYRWNQAGYATQPATPAFTPVNRTATDLTSGSWSKNNVTVAVVSGETDPDGLPTYKMAPSNTTASNIKRIITTANCPIGVEVKARFLIYADPIGFAIINGPEGLDTGRYTINLSTGVFTAFNTATNSGTAAAMAARCSTPVKRGNFWDFTITGVTRFSSLSPLIHMQPANGDEMSYTATTITDGIKLSRCEFVTR